jgi:AcrR family transcriptional regulator
MPPKKDKKQELPPKERIVAASLKLAEELGWQHISLNDIADECGMSLSELYDHCEDKVDVLSMLGRAIDKRTLADMGEIDESLPARDRLFDILMTRFDVMNEIRPGLRSILNSFKCDPKQVVISLPHLCRSMTWMTEAAGLDTTGLTGAAKIFGLSVVYLKTVRVWLADDSEDMSKTMAALDKDLGRAEQCANTFGF